MYRCDFGLSDFATDNSIEYNLNIYLYMYIYTYALYI